MDRSIGIGGSDAAACLGIAPKSWKRTPLTVYRQLIGEQPATEESEAMRWGKIHEPHVLAEYARRTGRKIRRSPELLRHPEHPWMVAHLDAVALDDVGQPSRVIEAKTSGMGWDWGRSSDVFDPTDEVPVYYVAQGQHYLAVTGLPHCDYPVLLNGNRWVLFHVERDEGAIAVLIEKEHEIVERAKRRDPPDPLTLEEWAEQPVTPGKIIVSDESLDADTIALSWARRNAREADAAAKEIALRIHKRAGDASRVIRRDGTPLLEISTRKRKAHAVGESTYREIRICNDPQASKESNP